MKTLVLILLISIILVTFDSNAKTTVLQNTQNQSTQNQNSQNYTAEIQNTSIQIKEIPKVQTEDIEYQNRLTILNKVSDEFIDVTEYKPFDFAAQSKISLKLTEALNNFAEYSPEAYEKVNGWLEQYIQDTIEKLFAAKIDLTRKEEQENYNANMLTYERSLQFFVDLKHNMGAMFEDQIQSVMSSSEFVFNCKRSDDECDIESLKSLLERFPDMWEQLGLKREDFKDYIAENDNDEDLDQVANPFVELKDNIGADQCDLSRLEALVLAINQKGQNNLRSTWSYPVQNIGSCTHVSVHWVRKQNKLKIINVEIEYPGYSNLQGLSKEDKDRFFKKIEF